MSKEKIIFDSDIGGDCDDAGALALLHALCEQGEAELLAATYCFMNPHAAGCLDAINTYYGKRVPVGVNTVGQVVLFDHYPPESGYRGYSEPIFHTFPHAYRDQDAPDTLTVLRETLAASGDGEVTIVVTGTLSSMARLVLSEGDKISPLSGKELISRKVKRTVVMGGRFFEGWPMYVIHGKDPVVRECNIIQDIAAAQTVCREWTGELIFASFELGNDCITLQDFAKNADYNPAALAYRLYPPAGLRGRESWDLIAMLYAVRPQGEAFKLHPWGKISVSDDGVTSFQVDEAGRHSFLLPRSELSLVRDEINAIVRGSSRY